MKDRFLIKKAYKKLNQFMGVDRVHYILADGNVITVSSAYTKAPSYEWIPNLDASIGKYGGICPNKDGGILIGNECDKGVSWEFKCVECEHRKIISEAKIDIFVHDAIMHLDEEEKFA